LKTIAAALVLFAAACSAVSATLVITIDKAAQRMTVSIDGKVRYNWPVSTGKAGYATPSGRFSIFRMEKTYFSKEWDDAPMPNAMFFTAAGNAIHGTYQIGRLGHAVSHGCVRLAPGNAAKLFAMVKAEGGGSYFGGPVVIITGPSPGLPSGVAQRLPSRTRKPTKLESFSVGEFGYWIK